MFCVLLIFLSSLFRRPSLFSLSFARHFLPCCFSVSVVFQRFEGFNRENIFVFWGGVLLASPPPPTKNAKEMGTKNQSDFFLPEVSFCTPLGSWTSAHSRRGCQHPGLQGLPEVLDPGRQHEWRPCFWSLGSHFRIQGLRGPAAILFTSRDTCSNSIAKLFVFFLLLLFYGVSHTNRATCCKMGYYNWKLPRNSCLRLSCDCFALLCLQSEMFAHNSCC